MFSKLKNHFCYEFCRASPILLWFTTTLYVATCGRGMWIVILLVDKYIMFWVFVLRQRYFTRFSLRTAKLARIMSYDEPSRFHHDLCRVSLAQLHNYYCYELCRTIPNGYDILYEFCRARSGSSSVSIFMIFAKCERGLSTWTSKTMLGNSGYRGLVLFSHRSSQGSSLPFLPFISKTLHAW